MNEKKFIWPAETLEKFRQASDAELAEYLNTLVAGGFFMGYTASRGEIKAISQENYDLLKTKLGDADHAYNRYFDAIADKLTKNIIR